MVKTPEWNRSGGFIGLAGMAVVFFLYASSGLVAPWWAVVLLICFWVVLFGLGCVWFMSRPTRVMLLPVVAAAVWFGALVAGSRLLGWTA